MTTPYQEKTRDQESEEALEQRLARVRARRRQHLALETAEERLCRRRVRLTDRRSAEMAEEREKQVRLNLQFNQQQRLETETQDERKARLHGLWVDKQQRFAAETPEEMRQRDKGSHMRPLILSPTSPSPATLETHATTQCTHAHIVVSPARLQCTALASSMDKPEK